MTPRQADPVSGVLCCECWRWIDNDGVTVNHLYGVEAHHADCYRSSQRIEDLHLHSPGSPLLTS